MRLYARQGLQTARILVKFTPVADLAQGLLDLGELLGGVVHNARGHVAHRVKEATQAALARAGQLLWDWAAAALRCAQSPYINSA